MTRSPILDASVQYWRWLGHLIDRMGRRRRQRSVFVIGGCLFWLVFGLFYLLAYFMVAAAVGFALLALAAFGVLLSAAGGVDQLRIAAMTRRSAPAD